MSATLTVYLRNGLSFTFTPSQAGLPAPSEKVIAQMMAQEIAPVDLAVPRIVIRWSEVVAVRIEENAKPRAPRVHHVGVHKDHDVGEPCGYCDR